MQRKIIFMARKDRHRLYALFPYVSAPTISRALNYQTRTPTAIEIRAAALNQCGGTLVETPTGSMPHP